MLTFNLVANNGNYYRGHEPSNKHGSCWTNDRAEALTLSLVQAREIAREVYDLRIEIALVDTAISDELFRKEMFCLMGGSWNGYKDNL